MAHIRIVGIGNLFRGDDAVGILAVQRLKHIMEGRADVIETEAGGLEILDLMDGAQSVILIDAAQSGQPVGTIHRLDASSGPISQTVFPHSTHAMNVSEALEIARALGKLPARVIVYGVEIGETIAGSSLTPAVARSLDEVVEHIQREVERLTCTNCI